LGAFYRSVVLAGLRHQRATIIIDGEARLDRSFYPMLPFYVDIGGAAHAEFWRLLEYSTERATAERMAEDVAAEIQVLTAGQVIVDAACADNGSNLRKAFKMSGGSLAVEALCGLPVLRSPCSNHTGNLILPDAERNVSGFRRFI
jgi:hypothetical protein